MKLKRITKKEDINKKRIYYKGKNLGVLLDNFKLERISCANI